MPSDLLRCPACQKVSLWFNSYTGLHECMNPHCKRKFTTYEIGKKVPTSSGNTHTNKSRLVIETPLWLVNIFESKQFWRLLIFFDIGWWAWICINSNSANDIGSAIGIAIPTLLLYLVKLIFRRYLNNYKTMASSHIIFSSFRIIRRSPWLRLIIILLIIYLTITIILSIFLLSVGGVQTTSVQYFIFSVILLAVQIYVAYWLINKLHRSPYLSHRPKFAVVFWPLFACLVFLSLIGIQPFSDVKDATVSLLSNISKVVLVENKSDSNTEPPLSTTPAKPQLGLEKSTVAEPSILTFNNQQPPYSKTISGARINLVNNQNAKDPTWQELLKFLNKDATDSKPYDLISFPCGAFAEEVHNNAEAAGIKAALVAIDFMDSADVHALNAFNTADKGLVYIDCTGKGWLVPMVSNISELSSKSYGKPTSWDKVAYIQIGKEYGIIGLNVASSPDYLFYKEYCNKKKRFEDEVNNYSGEVQQYNQSITGRVFYEGSSEYLKISQWEQRLKAKEIELDALGNSLGGFWESLGTVSKVKIYW